MSHDKSHTNETQADDHIRNRTFIFKTLMQISKVH